MMSCILGATNVYCFRHPISTIILPHPRFLNRRRPGYRPTDSLLAPSRLHSTFPQMLSLASEM